MNATHCERLPALPRPRRTRGGAAAPLLLLGVLALALAGCEVAGTEGEAGNFTFHDTTRAPGEFFQTDQQVDRPVAGQAFLALEVRENGIPVVPTEATSSIPDILTVVRTDASGVLLKARAPGEARITVRAAGKEDSVVLRVEPVGQTVIHLYPVGELAADQPALDVPRAVLLPGARIWGFVEQRGPDGQPLTGYGARPCAVDVDGAEVRMEEASDRFTLDAPPDKGDVEAVVLTCGLTELTLPVKTADAAASLEAYDFLREAFGPTLDVPAGQSTYVVAIARDAEGDVIQGAADEPVAVTVPEASKPYVEVVEHDPTTDIGKLLRQSRAVELRVAPGVESHTVTLGWHGLTHELTLRLAADE